MFEAIKKEIIAKVIVIVFILFSLWWLYLQITRATSIQNQIFGASYGLVALIGGISGIYVALKWGGLKSWMGKAIIMFSIGLFAQEFGQIIYSFYTFFFHVDIPYPSLGDIGYFGSIPFYILGVLFLAKVSGIKIGIKPMSSKIQAIIIPIILLVITDMLFLRNYQFDWTKPLTIFLDFGYPFGEAIYISLAILTYLLSRKILGGVMKNKILFILFALLVQFASDYIFLFFSRYGSIAPGGFNDYMYLTAYFLMAIALIQLKTVHDNLTNSTNK